MKKLLNAVISVLLLILFVVGCDEEYVYERKLFDIDLKEYVTLGDYSSITVDTSSYDFKSYYNSVLSDDIENDDFYDEYAQGEVCAGDTVNMDFTGKKDGIAFKCGTLKNCNLEIGSGDFYPDFENGLLGVEVGETVTLNIKFSKDKYPGLAGADVIFTVTVNYIKRPQSPEKYYSDLGFTTLKDYEYDVFKRAATRYLLDKAVDDAEIIKNSDVDIDAVYNSVYETRDIFCKNYYNVDFETYLSVCGSSLDKFKKEIVENVNEYMVFYAIMDEEEIVCNYKIINDFINDYAEKHNRYVSVIMDKTSETDREIYTVTKLAGDFLYKNAVIK